MKITLQDANVIVLGLGRVGLTVADRMSKLNANVSVGVRKTRDIAKAETLGFSGFHLDQLNAYIKKCHLLVNTIPVMMLDKKVLNDFSADAILIDLASKPGVDRKSTRLNSSLVAISFT